MTTIPRQPTVIQPEPQPVRPQPIQAKARIAGTALIRRLARLRRWVRNRHENPVSLDDLIMLDTRDLAVPPLAAGGDRRRAMPAP